MQSKIVVVFFSFISLLCLNKVSSQSYVKAYAVTHKGDTIKGTALTDNYNKLSTGIQFKDTDNKSLTIKPDAFKTVWMAPDCFFSSENIHYRHLTTSLDGQFFLQVLTDNQDIRLMKFNYRKLYGYYVKRFGETPKQLHTILLHQFDNWAKQWDTDSSRIDSLAYVSNNSMRVGRYQIEEKYLGVLKNYFPDCAVNINEGYKLEEASLIDIMTKLMACGEKKSSLTRHFQTKLWRPIVSVAGGIGVLNNDIDFKSPYSSSIFVGFGDLRTTVSIGVKFSNKKPTRDSLTEANFREWTVRFDSKIILKPTYYVGIFLGASHISSNIHKGFLFNPLNQISSIQDIQFNIFALNYGLTAAYQIKPNMYLGLEYNRSTTDILDYFTSSKLLEGSKTIHFSHLQIRLEKRF